MYNQTLLLGCIVQLQHGIIHDHTLLHHCSDFGHLNTNDIYNAYNFNKHITTHILTPPSENMVQYGHTICSYTPFNIIKVAGLRIDYMTPHLCTPDGICCKVWTLHYILLEHDLHNLQQRDKYYYINTIQTYSAFNFTVNNMKFGYMTTCTSSIHYYNEHIRHDTLAAYEYLYAHLRYENYPWHSQLNSSMVYQDISIIIGAYDYYDNEMFTSRTDDILVQSHH